jgi:hypothetical protein
MAALIKLSLTPDDLNLVLVALSQLPYRQVHELIERVQDEAGPQLLAFTRKDAHTAPQDTGP